MPQARITEVRDALAAFIDSAWTLSFAERGAADQVIAQSRIDNTIEPDRPEDYVTGRKVYVFEMQYERVGIADRGEDIDDYTLQVSVIEFCRDKGDPPEEWLDERKYFVDWLYRKVRNPRTVKLLDALWPENPGPVTPYDQNRLAEHKQFVSAFEITFREHSTPDPE